MSVATRIAVPRPRTAPPRSSGGLRRLVPALPEIVATVLARIDVELPDLAAAGWRRRMAEDSLLHAELLRGMDLFARGSSLEEADLRRYAAHFTATASSAATLLSMQRFCRSLIVEIFSELWARAEPGDVVELLRFSQWISRQNRVAEHLLAAIHAGREPAGPTVADRRRALAERLLAGLEEAGPENRDVRYLVVVMEDLDEPRRGPLRTGTLDVVSAGLRHLLVPVRLADSVQELWRTTAHAVDGVRAAAVLAADPSEVPAAAGSARVLLRRAAAAGLPAGLVGVRELALETALAAHPAGLRQVAALIDPIEADGRLWRTLTTFFAFDLERNRTAEALFISRSGLTLRLDRITRLTGYDPRSSRGIQVLRSALWARTMLTTG
jgi:PucR C-terminal helix-turn-helix domain